MRWSTAQRLFTHRRGRKAGAQADRRPGGVATRRHHAALDIDATTDDSLRAPIGLCRFVNGGLEPGMCTGAGKLGPTSYKPRFDCR